MNTVVLKEVESSHLQKHPEFAPGDTLEVSTVIRDGDRARTQVFTGIVIAIKGSGTRKTFTIRKISHGIGVEKILPLHSPNVSNIKIVKRGSVVRAKLYYMRKRVGRLAMKTGEGELGDDVMVETEVAAAEEETAVDKQSATAENEENDSVADNQKDSKAETPKPGKKKSEKGESKASSKDKK